MPVKKNRRRRRHQEEEGKRRYFCLPDDLFIPLLSQLTTEDVIRCRKVCKEWRDITCSRHFSDLHMQNQHNNHPIILVNAYKNGTLGEFLLDKWWESETTTVASMISKFNNFQGYRHCSDPQCSGNGFVVLKSEYCNCIRNRNLRKRNFIVFNPFYHDNIVTITFPKTLFRRTEAFAIYFHPTLQQNCILWAVYWRSYFRPKFDHPDEKGVQYQILLLGPEPSWRNITNPWIDKVKNPYKPTVLVEDKYLYWLVKHVENNSGKFAIMEFDIISEELKVISSPILCQGNIHLFDNNNISLLNVGILSLFLISPTEKLVYQWTLTDRVLDKWTSSIYSITGMCQFDEPVRAIALRDTGELLIEGSDKICVFNIRLGTMRILLRGSYSYSGITFMSHVITFASLSNCKSDITLMHVQNKRSTGANGEPEKCKRRVIISASPPSE